MSDEAAAWAPLFPPAEVPHILTAILRCGKRLKKEHDTELENRLSDRFRDLLDRDRGLRQRPVELLREVPIYDRTKSRGSCLGRVDFGFLFSTGSRKPWPYFAVECKRLNVSFPSGFKSLAADYVKGGQKGEGTETEVGVDERRGMMCFVTGRYAAGLRAGGMVGFVFDAKVDDAWTAVSDQIFKHRGILVTIPPHRLVSSNILRGETRVGETVHSRDQLSLTLYHLFVSV